MDYKQLNLGKEDLVRMYRMMYLIRHFEETAIAYSKQGVVIGNMHMYVGEEAVATGFCKAHGIVYLFEVCAILENIASQGCYAVGKKHIGK